MEFLSITGGVQIAAHIPERTINDLVSLLDEVPFRNDEGFCKADFNFQSLTVRAEGIIDEEWGRMIEALMLRLKPYFANGFDVTIQRPIETYELNIRLMAWSKSVRQNIAA